MLLKAISGSPSLRLVLDSINFSLTLLMSSYSELRFPSFWYQMSCRLNYCLNPGQLLLFLLFIHVYLNFVRMKTAFTIISDTSVRYRHMLPAKKIYASCSAWNRLEWPLLLTSHPFKYTGLPLTPRLYSYANPIEHVTIIHISPAILRNAGN